LSFVLTFEVDTIEILETVSNNELIKVRMLIAESGLNRHGMIISPDSIKKSAFTFIGKPILAKYDEKKGDVMGHERNESPVGVCALTKEDIEVVEDVKSTRLYTIGYMWRRYCSNITTLFERDGGRPISMEIIVTESHKDESDKLNIDAFCGVGTTVLGLDRNPAIHNAYAEMIEFEAMVTDMANALGFSIQKEEEGEKMFDKTEFALTFSMTANELRDIIEGAVNQIKYQSGDDIFSKYWVYDFNGEFAFVRDAENLKMAAIPYSISEGVCTLNLEGVKGARQTWEIEDEPTEDIMEACMTKMSVDFESKLAQIKEAFATEKATLEATVDSFATVGEKVKTLESEIETQKVELERLHEFEEVTIKTEREAAIEFALNEVVEDLKPDQIDEWREKSKTCTNPIDFSNELKAFAFGVSKGKNRQLTPPHIAIPIDSSENKNNTTLWNRLG